MELQENLEAFEKNGVRVFAVSYDPVEVLKAFSDRFGIAYPLLADTNSEVIRRFGILNSNIPEGHRAYGVPFPGTFMADPQGTVVEKSFYADHGVRDSVLRMLQEGFRAGDPGKGPAQEVETEALTARASLCSRTVRPGQALTFTLELEVKPGYHVYGRPVPEGYVPVGLEFEEVEGVRFEAADFPPGAPYFVRALNEELRVYAGRAVFKAFLVSRRKEGFAVRARLEYQACDDRECYLPERLAFELPLEYLDHVRD